MLLNFVFQCLEFLSKPSLVSCIFSQPHLCANLQKEEVCSFPECPDSPNKHTETVSIKSLLGQLLKHIASQFLHLDLTHLHQFIFYHKFQGLPAKFQHICVWQWLHDFLALPSFFQHSAQLLLPSSALPYQVKPGFFANQSYSQHTEGNPTS